MLQEAMEEIAVWEDLEQKFGELPEPEQPAPPGVQAPAVVLQQTPTEEEQTGGDNEAALPRDARGTAPIMDFARLTVSMLEHQEVTSLTPQIELPPVPEQAAPDEVEMAAEEVVSEEPEEEDGLGEVQALYGKDEKDLTEDERAGLAGIPQEGQSHSASDALADRNRVAIAAELATHGNAVRTEHMRAGQVEPVG